jgi:hypothetical protein
MWQTLNIPKPEVAAQLAMSTATIRHYCRAELDLNTDAETQQLPSQHLDRLWEKLTAFAGEILSKGDIR